MKIKLFLLLLVFIIIGLSTASSSASTDESTIESSGDSIVESFGESSGELPIDSIVVPLSTTSSNQSSTSPPSNTLPERFYNRFHLVTRRGWYGFLHTLGWSWFHSFSHSEETVYEADVKYYERTSDPQFFNVVIGEKDRNHTFIYNVSFGVPMDVVTPHGHYRVLYSYSNPFLYEQHLNDEDQPINPTVQSYLIRDYTLPYQLCVKYLYRDYPEQPYRQMSHSEWHYRKGRELSFWESLHLPKKVSEEDLLYGKGFRRSRQ